MEINKNFEQIVKSSNETKRGSTFITIYHRSIYFSKQLSTYIWENGLKYVNFLVGGNQIAIELYKTSKINCYEIETRPNKENRMWCQVTSTQLIRQIAGKLGLNIDRTKYYKSVDYAQKDDTFFFQIDKNLVTIRNLKN